MARSGIIYGGTGTRKTTQVKWFAHYIAETTGKATLLLSMDGGGWSPCQPEVDAGMIEPYFCDPALAPLPTLRKISQGYWPEDVTLPANQINLRRMDFTKFGGLAVEGWTSIGNAVMRYLPDKGINVGGEDRAKLGGFSQSVQVDGREAMEVFRSGTRGDYNFMQNYIYGFVMNCGSLPLSYVLHTAIENKTEDEDRVTVYGPAMPGKKATANCGPWVGDMIHAQDYPVEREIQVPNPSKPGEQMSQKLLDIVVRFYYKKHPDPASGILFPAKPRVTPEKVRELEKQFPGGYFESDDKSGFDLYLHAVDKLSQSQGDALKGWRERMDEKLGRGKAASPAPSPTPVPMAAATRK